MGKKRSRGGAAAAASDDDGGDGVPEIDVPDSGRKGPKPCSGVAQAQQLMENHMELVSPEAWSKDFGLPEIHMMKELNQRVSE